jgi:hypothetical protein
MDVNKIHKLGFYFYMKTNFLDMVPSSTWSKSTSYTTNNDRCQKITHENEKQL